MSARLVVMVAGVLLTARASAQTSNDTGSSSLMATVSGYMDLAAGGPPTLVGSLGGSVSGIASKGDPLTAVTVSLGDVSPMNPNSFVVARLPLRLRSNIRYSLTVLAQSLSSTDPLAVQASDIGFGIANLRRSDVGVHASGVDSPSSGVLGDPSTDGDFDPSSVRWDFAPTKSLSFYTTTRTVLSGERIMQVVPASLLGGLLLDTFFVIKPQFFSPGSFSTTVSFTISTP